MVRIRCQAGTKEDGQALVLVAVCMVALMGFAGLAIDVGQIHHVRHQLQADADAAALAGALEISECNNTNNCSSMQTAALHALSENGLSGTTLLTQCSPLPNPIAGSVLVLNNGPCYSGSKSADPNYGDPNYVEAVLAAKVPTIFAGVIGVSSVNVMARSEATIGNNKNCLFISAADPSSTSNQLLINGNATLDASTCSIMDDSSSSTALLVNGHSTVKATHIAVHGGALMNGNVSMPNPSTHVPAQSDPLAYLNSEPPQSSGCTYNNKLVNSGNGTVALSPGTYCGGLILNGNAAATLSPGVYIMQGSMLVNGGGSLTGSGVTFYFTSGGTLTMNGNAHADLVAPTTGTYAGILFYQSPGDSSTMILNGDSTSVFEGALYLPSAGLTINGNGNLAAYTIVDAASMIINGNDSFTLGSDYSSLPGGSPARGGTAILAE